MSNNPSVKDKDTEIKIVVDFAACQATVDEAAERMRDVFAQANISVQEALDNIALCTGSVPCTEDFIRAIKNLSAPPKLLGKGEIAQYLEQLALEAEQERWGTDPLRLMDIVEIAGADIASNFFEGVRKLSYWVDDVGYTLGDFGVWLSERSFLLLNWANKVEYGAEEDE